MLKIFFTLLSLLLLQSLLTNGCSNIELVSREKWGARVPRSRDVMATPVPHIFIHHTAMTECRDFASCSKMARSIQNYHMDNKGWSDIGYNFLIGGDGRVYVGRGWNRVGAHTYGYNRNAVAFSVMGDFSKKVPSNILINATKKMIQCAVNEKRVAKNYQLHGHKDASCTECPGKFLYDIIKKWPKFVGGRLPGYKC